MDACVTLSLKLMLTVRHESNNSLNYEEAL
jgi:hypothetical protein